MNRIDSHVETRTDSIARRATVYRASRVWLAAFAIGGALFVLYLNRLAPTVGSGDTADLQAQTPLLGVGHPPGYVLQIFAGKIFLLLTPEWGETAYRLNLFTAICAVMGCLLLYAAIYNLTRSIVAASWGALVLGLSSIYWERAVATDVYVFHSLFIILAILLLTQHFRYGRVRDVYGACLSLGVAVAGRPSEAFILPAFIPAFVLAYARLPRKPRKLLVSLCVFLAPFVVSVGYYLTFHNTGLLLTEDQRAVERILEIGDGGDGQPGKTFSEALRYCLALKWLDRSMGSPSAASRARYARRYANLMTGQLDSRGRPVGMKRLEQGNGMSVGPAALAVAAAALILPGGLWLWIFCGLGLFAGNFAFYLWHPRWDGLSFVIPSLIGISLLAGIGAHKIGSRRAWLRAAVAMLLVAVASTLYLANRKVVDRSFLTEPLLRPHMSAEEAKEIPRRSILVASYWTATTYKYIVEVAAGRRDVQVVKRGRARGASWFRSLTSTGRPVFVMRSRGARSDETTPAVLRKYNFRRVR